MEAATTCLELRAALGALEEAVDAGHLSGSYVRHPLLVKGAWLPVGGEVASAVLGPGGEVQVLSDREAMEGGKWHVRHVGHVLWGPGAACRVCFGDGRGRGEGRWGLWLGWWL